MPFVSDELYNDICMANDIVDYASSFLNLKKSGRSYMACCPFHNEKTPSFHIDRDKQLFHCFGCGAHGDVIKFVMMLFNLSFAQAVIRLSSDFGLGLTPTRETPKEARERIRAHQEAEEAKRRKEAEYLKKSQEHCYWWNIAKEHAPTRENMDNPEFEFDDLYVEALHRLPSLEYWLDEHLGR